MGKTRRRVAGRPRCAHRSRGGFTIVEIAVAVMVFTISVGAISTTLVTTVSMSRTSQETSIAMDAAQSVLADMRAMEFDQVFGAYSTQMAASPGKYFEVEGLTVQPGDPDGFVGEVSFPGNGLTLREDVLDEELGMRTGAQAGRDLNMDGSIDSLDHSTDYTILPVRVRLEWRGAGGDQSLDVVSVLSVR